MSKKRLEDNVLAEGEATGHAHRVFGDAVSLWGTDDGAVSVDAPSGAVIRHEEHRPVTLPPGSYTRRIVQEYDHFAEEARIVVD